MAPSPYAKAVAAKGINSLPLCKGRVGVGFVDLDSGNDPIVHND